MYGCRRVIVASFYLLSAIEVTRFETPNSQINSFDQQIVYLNYTHLDRCNMGVVCRRSYCDAYRLFQFLFVILFRTYPIHIHSAGGWHYGRWPNIRTADMDMDGCVCDYHTVTGNNIDVQCSC